MSRIHCKNTKPEEIVRKHLFSHGFIYRINDKRYPGKPDIVLPKYKTVIFANGCLWHHHGCERDGGYPKSSTEFWQDKIEKKVARDKQQYLELENARSKISIIWECQISASRIAETLQQLLSEINNH